MILKLSSSVYNAFESMKDRIEMDIYKRKDLRILLVNLLRWCNILLLMF